MSVVNNNNNKLIIEKACLLLVAVFSACSARAEFALNFIVTNEYELPGRDSAVRTYYWNSDNEWGRQGMQTGTGPSPAQTPYLYDANSLERPQIVIDPDTGNTYYHMLFGSFADGFIQESYIQMGFGNYGSRALGEPLNSGSASGGYSVYNSTTTFGNGYDPLDMDKDAAAQSVTSGNGTANPNRVILRQIMSDGEVMIEVVKDKYANKPRISQMINAPDIVSMFDLDMRQSTYSDMTTPAVIFNTMQLWGEGLPSDSGAFDMNTDARNFNVNAGKFTYAEGAGFGGSEGSYTYSEGDFDINSVRWGNYIDPDVYNPWAFEGSKIY